MLKAGPWGGENSDDDDGDDEEMPDENLLDFNEVICVCLHYGISVLSIHLLISQFS